jgi:putative oxidoreductase
MTISADPAAIRARAPAWMKALDLAGRLMIGALFAWSGVFGIVLAWPSIVDTIARRGLPAPTLLGAAAGAVELIGPVALLVPRFEAIAALLLAGYCVATAVFFHDYWTLQNPERLLQMFHFMKNIALSGALLVIAVRPLTAD